MFVLSEFKELVLFFFNVQQRLVVDDRRVPDIFGTVVVAEAIPKPTTLYY